MVCRAGGSDHAACRRPYGWSTLQPLQYMASANHAAQHIRCVVRSMIAAGLLAAYACCTKHVHGLADSKITCCQAGDGPLRPSAWMCFECYADCVCAVTIRPVVNQGSSVCKHDRGLAISHSNWQYRKCKCQHAKKHPARCCCMISWDKALAIRNTTVCTEVHA